TEQIELRDRTCVFPWCNRPARGCDKDHVVPWEHGGPTSSDNLAALCRRHHRLKTHGGWTYTRVEPGTYLWR
ncbi:HNH endonuclease signature motif containing protein, partial [Nocardioides pocheonensis]